METKHIKYNHSEKGLQRNRCYDRSEKGKYRHFKANLRYRMKIRTQKIQQLEAELERSISW